MTMDPRTPWASGNELHRPPRGSDEMAMGLDQVTIEGLRAMIRAGGARQLAVGDLRADEIAELAWYRSG
jgi:hypothetical protein